MRALRTTGICLVLALVACPARADEEMPATFLWHLRAPNLDDPAFLKEIKEYQPDLLLLGRAVPFDSAMGPISKFGGADSSAKDVKGATLLKPKDVEERVKFLRRMNVVLHESGVKIILPYASAISLIGEPEKPSGFFKFYRRWRDYPGLGDRPTPSPKEWFAVDKLGTPLPVGDKIDPDPDPLRPMKRYAACPSNPAWQAWMQQVAQSCATVGYDGLYLDHCVTKPCHCRYCREKFQSFLSSRYPPGEIKTCFGTNIENVRLSEEKDTLAGVETTLFRQMMLRKLLAGIRSAGGERSLRLLVKGVDFWQIEQFADVADFFAFDATRQGQLFNVPGTQDRLIVNGIYDRQSYNNIIPYKCAAGLPQKRQLAINIHTQHPIIRELSFAEALAFASPPLFGGPKTFSDPASRKKYRDFLSKRAELFVDTSPYADVAVLFFGRQKCFPRGRRHVIQAQFVMGRLATHRVPFEVVTEGNCNPSVLSKYRVVIVPALFYIGDSLTLAFQQYVEQGGTLVVSEDSFRYDERCIERKGTWLESAIKRPESRKKEILHVPVKEGWIVHTPRFFDDEALAQGIRRGIEIGPLQIISHGAWHVRVNARIKQTEPAGDILLHFVNYNICPKRKPSPILPAKGAFCSLRTLPNWSVFSVTADSPDNAVTKQIEYSYDKEHGVLRFRLPEVKIYTIVRVSCRAAK